MKPVIGGRYTLLDTFAGSGLNWEAGTTVTVVSFPHSPEFFGERRCACVDSDYPDLEISTPVELLQALETRRRRKRTPNQNEPAPRRRRRKKRG